MPELPEVETTRRGIEPHLLQHRVAAVIVRKPRLRWPIPDTLPALLEGRRVEAVERRGKYLLLRFAHGTLILHLGMSGSLRVLAADAPVRKHDHVDLRLDDGQCLRLHDPRRFGAVLWCAGPAEAHPLLRDLGPEPLSPAFDGEHLRGAAAGRKTAIKNLIMDSHVVVGVGNIYASESLFLAGIHPQRPAGRVAASRLQVLAQTIKQVLSAAIRQGGTTLRDFTREDGSPGYFALSLNVYGRDGERCPRCDAAIRRKTIGQRASFYCPRCQR